MLPLLWEALDAIICSFFGVGEEASWHISDLWSPKYFTSVSGNQTFLVYVVYLP